MIYIHRLTKPTPTRRLPIKFLNVVLDTAYVLFHVFLLNSSIVLEIAMSISHIRKLRLTAIAHHTSISVTAKIHTQVRALPTSRRHR